MEGGLKNYYIYRERALAELGQIEKLGNVLMPESVVSRAYYAAFYAMKAQLALQDVPTKSHKQTLIEFRKQFIKTKLLPVRFSKLITKLLEWRELADYDVMWKAPISELQSFLKDVHELVHSTLDINTSPTQK